MENIEGVPKCIDTIIISAQHMDTVNMMLQYKDINENIIKPTMPVGMMDEYTKIY